MLFQILFWAAVLSILHTYLFYPIILKWAAPDEVKSNRALPDQTLPFISIIIAAYNEELVIAEKLQSIVDSSYPMDKIEVYVGSDGSTDRTNTIVEHFANQYDFIKLSQFTRSGKTGVLNKLIPIATAEIIVFTDANVVFNHHTLSALVVQFNNPDIGLIGANITSKEHQELGISVQEDTYIQRENKIKYREGVLWGAMMGAFGGCYAVRKSLLKPIPRHFIVDDFFITMNVLLKKKKTVLEPHAICFEEVSIKESEEYRRKVRMSSGNFQNLFHFKSFFWKVNPTTIFCYVSHKILRWITPVLLIISFVTAYFLMPYHWVYTVAWYAQLLLFVTPLFNYVLIKLNVRVKPIQFISYFYSMNVALFVGMIKFFYGIKSSIWEPTERNPTGK